jgi:hypothetical protein
METPVYSCNSGSNWFGKTVFGCRFLKHLSEITEPVPAEVLYCYGEWQHMYESMNGVNFHEWLPDVE